MSTLPIATINRVTSIPDELGRIHFTIAGQKFEVFRDLLDRAMIENFGPVEALADHLRWSAGVDAHIDMARIEAGLDRSAERWSTARRAAIDALVAQH